MVSLSSSYEITDRTNGSIRSHLLDGAGNFLIFPLKTFYERRQDSQWKRTKTHRRNGTLRLPKTVFRGAVVCRALILTACFAFTWIVGFLSFLTPGGIGIREGLLGLLLANYMPAPQATLVALLCRVWMLSAEMVLAGVAFALNRKQGEV